MKICANPIKRAVREDVATQSCIPRRRTSLIPFLALCLAVLGGGAGFETRASDLGSPAAISDELAVRAIVGEAANQGPRGMLAVACAIRNRGHLRGVFGVSATFVNRESPQVWEQARQAWAQSAQRDITGGATHWENVRAFGRPAWARRMTTTVTIRDHTFFRSRRMMIASR